MKISLILDLYACIKIYLTSKKKVDFLEHFIWLWWTINTLNGKLTVSSCPKGITLSNASQRELSCIQPVLTFIQDAGATRNAYKNAMFHCWASYLIIIVECIRAFNPVEIFVFFSPIFYSPISILTLVENRTYLRKITRSQHTSYEVRWHLSNTLNTEI